MTLLNGNKTICIFCGPRLSCQYSDLLRRGWLEGSNPWNGGFSAPVHTGPEAHTACYAMGTGSLPGVKRSGRGFDHPRPSSAKVKEKSYSFTLCLGFIACSMVNFTFYLCIEFWVEREMFLKTATQATERKISLR
jgi:hypothetical protein